MSLKSTNLFYLLHKAHCANGCLVSYPIFNLVLLLNKRPGQVAGFHLKCHCWRSQLTSWTGLKVAIPDSVVLLKWDPVLLSLDVTRTIIKSHCHSQHGGQQDITVIWRAASPSSQCQFHGLVAVVQEENQLESRLLPSRAPSVMGKIASSVSERGLESGWMIQKLFWWSLEFRGLNSIWKDQCKKTSASTSLPVKVWLWKT